jgi:3-hydroxybutyryl-CoA dehydrogenase
MSVKRRVAVIGSGLMGTQIAAEFALGGHPVEVVSRDPSAAADRIDQAFAAVGSFGLFDAAQVEAGRAAITVSKEPTERFELAIESVPEDLDLKVNLLRELAKAAPEAILASNTSSLSITALGKGAGAGDRMVGMHYWRPPLLMPLVEVVSGEETAPGVVAEVGAVLRSIGKRPVLVEKDVPGFVWNRLQFAILREAVWLVENGVASPQTIDEVVTEGLARRWEQVGPMQTVSVGGRDTWVQVGQNLTPELSTASQIDGLPDVGPESPQELEELRRDIDRRLAARLARDRAEPPA